MGKKKNLTDGLTNEEIEYIDSKKNNFGINKDVNFTDYSKIMEYKISVKCKNEKQKLLCKNIDEKEIIFSCGAAGSGKSYISLGMALKLLKSNDNSFKKIIIVIPTVQSDLEIGFLPGTVDEKLQYNAEPSLYTMEKILRDSGNIGAKQIISNLIKYGIIEIRCVSFMRGFTIDNSIVVIEESQQFPKSAFKTLLSRIGDNSKYIFNGDIEQVDNKNIKNGKEECGLKYAMHKLIDIEEIACIEFNRDEIVRNKLISKILDKWDSENF